MKGMTVPALIDCGWRHGEDHDRRPPSSARWSWTVLVAMVALVARVASAQAPSLATEHAMVPQALTVAEAHQLLSEARWPDGPQMTPEWTMDAWLAVERALDEHADARQRRLVPLIVALDAEFPDRAWQRTAMLEARAHILQERAVNATVALERELFESIRRGFDATVPIDALPEWRAANDRAERRRRRSALLRPGRLMHATVGDVEWVVRDAVPDALADPIVRELLDHWAMQLDGRLEALASAEREARERYRAALGRIEINPVVDLASLRLRGGDTYPPWLEVSAPLRSAVSAEVANGRSTIETIAARLDAASGRALVDRWHRLTHKFPVRHVSGAAPTGTEAALAAWSEAELASRQASARIVERHSPAQSPLARVSPLPAGLLAELIPPLALLDTAARQRADAVTALADAHGAEVAARIGVLRGSQPEFRWSRPARFDGRRIAPVRLFALPEHFGTPAPESLCLRPPHRADLETVGRATHRDPTQMALLLALTDGFAAAMVAADLELGDRGELPMSFLRRPRAEPSIVHELLDREERRTERQMALEAQLFTRATMLADPDAAPLVQLIAAARRIDHLLLPTRYVVEHEMALGDDSRATANPLTIVAHAAIEARARHGKVARDAGSDALDRAIGLALDAAPQIDRLATIRSNEARAFRREHLPQFLTPSATMPMEARIDRAAARWWRADDSRRREAARVHDRLIDDVAAVMAPDFGVRRHWLTAAWPTIHGLEPSVRSRIEQAIERDDRGEGDRLDALDDLLKWLDDEWSRLADAAVTALADTPPAIASSNLIGEAEIESIQLLRAQFETARRDLAERAAARLSVIEGERDRTGR